MPKRRDRIAGFCVERDEAVARRDVENSLFAAVGPVRQAAAGELPRRCRAALTFVLAVHPQQLAGGRVECDDGPPGAGGRVDDAVDHQRRRFELVLGSWAQVVGLEPPGDIEFAEVARVDLIERRIPRVAQVGAVGRPLAISGARLAGHRQRRPDEQTYAVTQRADPIDELFASWSLRSRCESRGHRSQVRFDRKLSRDSGVVSSGIPTYRYLADQCYVTPFDRGGAVRLYLAQVDRHLSQSVGRYPAGDAHIDALATWHGACDSPSLVKRRCVHPPFID